MISQRQSLLNSLEKIGLANFNLMFNKEKPWEDPFKNGILLHHVLNKLKFGNILNIKKNPQSMKECKYNLDLCFQMIRKQKLNIPYELIWKIDEILSKDDSIMIGIISHLLKINDDKLTRRNSSLNLSNQVRKNHIFLMFSGFSQLIDL
jgi:hypothetical protein